MVPTEQKVVARRVQPRFKAVSSLDMQRYGMGEETQLPDSVQLRDFALLAIGFGCMIGYSRMLSLGFVGYLSDGVIQSVDAWYALRSASCLGALALLAVNGWRQWFRLGTRSLMVTTAVAIASAIVFALDASQQFGWLVAVAGGVSNSLLMYMWLLLLSSYDPKTIVKSSLAGLVIAGAIIMGVPRADVALGLVVAVVAAFAAGACAILLDSDLASCTPDGPLVKGQAARVPWLTVVMIVVCSFLATVLYGIAQHLTWLYDWQPNYMAFGVGVVIAVGASVALMARTRMWAYHAWIPLFALLLVALAFSCVSVRWSIQVGVGLFLAAVFSAHFLHWPLFSGLLSQQRIPRAFLAGITLMCTNGSLASLLGDTVGAALPHSMQNFGGVAGMTAIALGVVFIATLAICHKMFGLGAILPLAVAPGAAAGMDDAESAGELSADAAAQRSDDVPEPAPSPLDFLKRRMDELKQDYGLTPREQEVGLLTVQGFSCAYIAEKLVVSESTVRFHQKNLYKKLDVHSRNELIEFVNAQ